MLTIGIDAGGTKTALLIQGESHTPQLFSAGGANYHRHGLTKVVDIIGNLILEALNHCQSRHYNADNLNICAGIAGAGIKFDQDQIEKELSAFLINADQPNHKIMVADDGLLALETALPNESGFAVITGTGSIVYARSTDGSRFRAGGWGYILGDEGSGYQLGRHGLIAVLNAYEGGTKTALVAAIKNEFGFAGRQDIINAVYKNNWAIAKAAPIVIHAAENDDHVATLLVKDQAEKIIKQILQLNEQIHAKGKSTSGKVAFLGGVSQSDYYQTCLQKAVVRLSGQANTTLNVTKPSQNQPVWGALRLANRMS